MRLDQVRPLHQMRRFELQGFCVQCGDFAVHTDIVMCSQVIDLVAKPFRYLVLSLKGPAI